ncbi:MAG TPA: hypothetical protein VFH89_14390 [Sphingomicrobium sp.]|nr:hypothetical protein [Sphingomicrobium sp.]
MKTFKNLAAQGDMMLVRIAVLPEGVQEIEAVNGRHTLAHSETGHDHVVLERPGVKMFKAMDELRALLDGKPAAFLVIEDEPAELKHLRDFDTHESVKIEPGIYEVRRQREYTPEGFRRAAD